MLLQRPALPSAGEGVVTKESFVSVCWRLIPYWLNNWEQQWGAECSSMMFELPHFAIELLVVLPCVQVRQPSLWRNRCSLRLLICQSAPLTTAPDVNVHLQHMHCRGSRSQFSARM